MNPSELLLQIAAGDQTAFRQIYTGFYKRLYKFSLAIVKTRESAEEVVEDVLVSIWQKRNELSTIRNLRDLSSFSPSPRTKWTRM